MRVLGVDPGQARVGLAISDEARRLALPLCTVPAGKNPAQAVVHALTEAHANGSDTELGVTLGSLSVVVVGLPLRLDGTEGVAARAARAFGDQLHQALREAIGGGASFELVFWDERLTTVVAERALTLMRVRGQERRAVVDQAAATLLLQSFLDARSREQPGHQEHPENNSWQAAENETGSEAAPRGALAGRRGKKRPKRKKR